MFVIFTWLADWLTYRIFALPMDSKLADAVHFFIEDSSKILLLLTVMIYVIALLRASLNVETVRDYLAGKRRGEQKGEKREENVSLPAEESYGRGRR